MEVSSATANNVGYLRGGKSRKLKVTIEKMDGPTIRAEYGFENMHRDLRRA